MNGHSGVQGPERQVQQEMQQKEAIGKCQSMLLVHYSDREHCHGHIGRPECGCEGDRPVCMGALDDDQGETRL